MATSARSPIRSLFGLIVAVFVVRRGALQPAIAHKLRSQNLPAPPPTFFDTRHRSRSP